MSYKKRGDGVMRLADGTFIPPDTQNADWREYLAWVSKGNTAEAEFTLGEAKARALARITEARNAALASLVVTFDGDDWDADEATSARIANALTMIREVAELQQPVPTEVAWRTADNQDRTLSIAELTGLGAAVFLGQQTVWGRQAALKNQASAARSVAEADAVQWG